MSSYEKAMSRLVDRTPWWRVIVLLAIWAAPFVYFAVTSDPQLPEGASSAGVEARDLWGP